MPKSNAHSGSATFLDDPPADVYRPPANRDKEARPSRSARALADADDEAGEPFLRARRRVPVRRGLLPVWARSRWGRVAFAGVTLAAVGGAVALILAIRSFLDHDPRFRIASPAAIQTMGNSQLTRADLLSVSSAAMSDTTSSRCLWPTGGRPGADSLGGAGDGDAHSARTSCGSR